MKNKKQQSEDFFYGDELTEAMHSEFTIDEETEIKHKCIIVWCKMGGDETDPDFPKLCNSYGITTEQAIENKAYCLDLINE